MVTLSSQDWQGRYQGAGKMVVVVLIVVMVVVVVIVVVVVVVIVVVVVVGCRNQWNWVHSFCHTVSQPAVVVLIQAVIVGK